MIWRYNWLRRRGYVTVTGTNWRDPDLGSEWCELVMMKDQKIKKVSINGMTWRAIVAIEEVEREQKQ
ncbi:hypothetical protein [Mycolicibacterium neoaurum]|uniref:hypothetical protein n=1 Tax=Mycolicibacterium neoaurum TaxID=1795 RepID=UPI001F4CD128|nr:hypothetical protein [Mycolicibacterium neoaurum]